MSSFVEKGHCEIDHDVYSQTVRLSSLYRSTQEKYSLRSSDLLSCTFSLKINEVTRGFNDSPSQSQLRLFGECTERGLTDPARPPVTGADLDYREQKRVNVSQRPS